MYPLTCNDLITHHTYCTSLVHRSSLIHHQVVAADEARANEAAAKSQEIKDECEMELAEAIPALEAAINALNTLRQVDITEVKTMKVAVGVGV